MEPARSIAQLGFKKWYERRLLESHAWLFTAILCAFVVALAIELVSFKHHVLIWLGWAGLAFVGGLIVMHGLRRFHQIFAEAQHLARQSTCHACHKYATFNVIAEAPRMTVRCRNCGNEWTFH